MIVFENINPDFGIHWIKYQAIEANLREKFFEAIKENWELKWKIIELLGLHTTDSPPDTILAQ